MAELTITYAERNARRQQTLEEATMNFVAYFMGLGDTKAVAESKVAAVSTEVAAYLYPYILGNTQPLIDSINASALSHMDAAAKAKLTGDLLPQ